MSQGFSTIRPLIHSLKTPDNKYGRSHTAWMPPYFVWRWKQNELFRQMYEYQMEHLRRIYRRQWFESYRINADEYLSVYSKAKAAQYLSWQKEVLNAEKKRKEDNWKIVAAKQLGKKQSDLWREYSEKKFFYWYERASERIQQMNALPWIKREELGKHIDLQLDKYVATQENGSGPHLSEFLSSHQKSSQKYPLNFVGQMPMLEDRLGNVASVPLHNKQHYDLHTKQYSDNDQGSQKGKGTSMKYNKQLSQKVNVYDPGYIDHLHGISPRMREISITDSSNSTELHRKFHKDGQVFSTHSVDAQFASCNTAQPLSACEELPHDKIKLRRNLKDRGGPFVKT